MSQTNRTFIDRVILGHALEMREDKEMLALGREAALRLRRGRLNSEQRSHLVDILEELGQKKEAARLAKSVKPASTSGFPPGFSSRTYRRASSSGDKVKEHIVKGERLSFDDASFDRVMILDVIEHIADQKSILDELRRVLKPTGRLILSVPGKHLFSFLDRGNWKFYFPNLHRRFYVRKHGRDAYEYRYGESNPFGLFGDIEREKGIHEHFNRKSLRALLSGSGFEVELFDGSGFFQRTFTYWEKIIPAKGFWRKCHLWDRATFQSTNLFCLARPLQ